MSKRYLKFGLVMIAAGGTVYLLYKAGLIDWLHPETLRAIVTSYGAFAPIVFIAAYFLATVLFVPASPLSLLSGALFGPLYGTLYVVLGATLGALAAFTVSRRASSLFMCGSNGAISKKLQGFDERIAQNGLVTVLFLRLVPLFPFNGLNFALGLTRVRFRDYAIGTFFGIMPGTFAYVYFGDSLASLNPLHIGLGIILILLVVVGGKFFMRRYPLINQHENK